MATPSTRSTTFPCTESSTGEQDCRLLSAVQNTDLPSFHLSLPSHLPTSQRYFLMVATYFLFGDNIFFYYPEYRTLGVRDFNHSGTMTIIDFVPLPLSFPPSLPPSLPPQSLLSPLAQYHRILSFSLYILGTPVVCVCAGVWSGVHV